MSKIELIHGDALKIKTSAELIFTDPPFEMNGQDLKIAFDNVECNHLVLICTMKQYSELIQCTEWSLNFDLVLNHVVPKKSKSIHQPNYTHSNVFYLTKPNTKSIFNRKLRERSDTFESNGYFPSIVHAPRENLQEHGMSKNENAMIDILGCFDAEIVCDPFAGSGTTGYACLELDKNCILIELNFDTYEKTNKKFSFLAGEY